MWRVFYNIALDAIATLSLERLDDTPLWLILAPTSLVFLSYNYMDLFGLTKSPYIMLILTIEIRIMLDVSAI